MSALLDRTREGFARNFGAAPEGIVFVPGRVNLIGDHVDYNDGLVLPMPISAGTAIAWGRTEDAAVEAVALDLDNASDRFEPAQVAPETSVDWRAYVRGMASSELWGSTLRPGVRMAIAGSIPRGSGLSSSASLCVAVGKALAAAFGRSPSATDLSLAAQATEHDWAGVKCGIMDQMAVAAGEPRAALLLDCADLSYRNAALPDDWAVIIVQSGVRRELAEGAYNERRADCETAAGQLGVASLRHADAAMLAEDRLDPLVERRARHVIEEIARVEDAAAALANADIARMGDMMRASHASLRDLFGVSHPKVDELVEIMNRAIGRDGGARMTGGGFGGAAVAVMPRMKVEDVAQAVTMNYTSPARGSVDISIE